MLGVAAAAAEFAVCAWLMMLGAFCCASSVAGCCLQLLLCHSIPKHAHTANQTHFVFPDLMLCCAMIRCAMLLLLLLPSTHTSTGVHQHCAAASWGADVCADDDQQAVCECAAVNGAVWALPGPQPVVSLWLLCCACVCVSAPVVWCVLNVALLAACYVLWPSSWFMIVASRQASDSMR